MPYCKKKPDDFILKTKESEPDGIRIQTLHFTETGIKK